MIPNVFFERIKAPKNLESALNSGGAYVYRDDPKGKQK
jgi:hypothetical protein